MLTLKTLVRAIRWENSWGDRRTAVPRDRAPSGRAVQVVIDERADPQTGERRIVRTD